MDDRFVIIVPARAGSSRLPNKPLAMIYGRTLIGRVINLALSSNASEVFIATDDNLIKDHFQQIFQYQVRLYDHKLCFIYSTFDDSRLGSCLYLKKVLEDTFKLSCELEWSESIEPGGSGKYFWLKDMRKK